MEITGTKNLSLLKRALMGHIVNCSIKSTRGSDQESTEIYDPEIKATEELLKAIDVNIERLEKSERPDCGPSEIN